MKSVFTRMLLMGACIFLLSSFLLNNVYSKTVQEERVHSFADSTDFFSQVQIDSLEKVVWSLAEADYTYNESTGHLERLRDSAVFQKTRVTELALSKHRLLKIFKASPDTSKQALERFEKEFLITCRSYESIAQGVDEISNREIPQLTLKVNDNRVVLEHTRRQYNKMNALLDHKLERIKSGAFARYFFGKKCRFYIAGPSSQIKIYHNPGAKPFTIEAIAGIEKERPEMITNGGMFEPGYKPQGLLIENGIEKKALDTVKRNDENFYMLPNAVFYVDSANRSFISESRTFARLQSKAGKQKYPGIRYATQSGPMLVQNGEIHKMFNPHSKNLNIRSGVGIMKDGRVVFLISDDPINFYQFATIFRHFFQCRDALYLDGAISKMYTEDKSLYKNKNFQNDNGGGFGPMISVVNKK